jgi:hypothetical protein
MMTPGMTGATNPQDPALTGPANPTAGMGNGGAVHEELQILGLEPGPMQQYAMISGIMQQTQQQMAQMNAMFSANQDAINACEGLGTGGAGGGMGAGLPGAGGTMGMGNIGGGQGVPGLGGNGMGVANGLGNYLGTPMNGGLMAA